MWNRILARLDSPRAPFILAALALLLSAVSLGFGLQSDDHMQRTSFQHGISPWRMLQLPPELLAAEREIGVFSWWTSPQLVIRFFRPLASITHWLEFRFWPEAAWAMHLNSALCYAALVAVAALTYRALLGAGKVASLAGLLFTIDPGHGQSVGWISSRNTLLATLFGLSAFLLHVRARATRRGVLVFSSAGCSALALFSAEFGVFVFAYLGAYALVLDDGAPRERWLSLAPHALVGMVWAAIYVTGGYGMRHSGWYRDPSADPFGVLLEGACDIPIWLFSQLGLNIGEFVVLTDIRMARVVCLVLLLPFLAWIMPVVRSSRPARFFAVGMLLSLPALSTTYPQGRLLIGASFGGLGLIACALEWLAESRAAFQRAGRAVLRALHLHIAPWLFLLMIGQHVGIERAAEALARALPEGAAHEAVVINLPFELLSQIAWNIRESKHAPAPASFHTLHAGRSLLRIERIDERTLEIEAREGWGRVPFERLFCTRGDLPKLGSTRALRNLRATVLEATADGRPGRVRFEFPSALESPQRTWLVWQGRRPAPFTLPRPGERIELQPVSPFDLTATGD